MTRLLIIMIITLIPIRVYPAIITVQESGGDYTSLATALSNANASDTIQVNGTWTSADTNAGTVSDANLIIIADSDSHHNGVYNTANNHYRLEYSGTSDTITVSAAGLTMTGLAFKYTGTTSSQETIDINVDSSTTTIEECLFWGANDTNQSDGIYSNNDAITVNVVQCGLWQFARAAIHAQNHVSMNTCTWNINSCTIYLNGTDSTGTECDDGGGVAARWSGDSTVINVHNTISIDNDGCGGATGSADFQEFNDGTDVTWGISYSIDSDNSIATVDGGGSGNLASRTIVESADCDAVSEVCVNEKDTAPYDLLLVDDSADNDAQDAHAVATAEGITINTPDVDGTVRPDNTNYEIGFDEIATAGATTILPQMMQHSQLSCEDLEEAI